MSQPLLLIATSNEGKLAELRAMLSDLPFDLAGLKDFPNIQPIPETGSTFIENAALKAAGYARQIKLPTLADDSGLEVKALGGAPGVFSARFLGDGVSYAERNRTLLAALEKATDRSARFVCAVALAGPDGRVFHVLEETCEGHLAKSPRGFGGFGYDPIFIPSGYKQTFGELSLEVKNRISHRARAIAAAREFLRSLTGAQTAG